MPPLARAAIDKPDNHARPARLPRRLAALVYDSLLLAALAMTYTLIVVALRGFRAVEPGTWWFPAGLIALSVAFFVWCWTRGGRTLGMQAWRLRIERADGGPVRWTDALLRCAAALLSLLPAGLGYWWALIDREHRAWHDRLSRTRIVHQPRARR
jgi:uncharacterized RDD family membrane protein YckC